MPKEFSIQSFPLDVIEEMEVEMILLNLTEEILENAKKEGREVVVVEMTRVGVVEALEGEVAETPISRKLETQPPTLTTFPTK